MFDLGLAELAASATASARIRIRIRIDQIFVKQGGTDDSVFHWHQDRPF